MQIVYDIAVELEKKICTKSIEIDPQKLGRVYFDIGHLSFLICLNRDTISYKFHHNHFLWVL